MVREGAVYIASLVELEGPLRGRAVSVWLQYDEAERGLSGGNILLLEGKWSSSGRNLSWWTLQWQ